MNTALHKNLPSHTALSVRGMMCQNSCGNRVLDALLNLRLVNAAASSCKLSSALVIGTAPASVLIRALEDVGFEAEEILEENSKRCCVTGLERSIFRKLLLRIKCIDDNELQKILFVESVKKIEGFILDPADPSIGIALIKVLDGDIPKLLRTVNSSAFKVEIVSSNDYDLFLDGINSFCSLESICELVDANVVLRVEGMKCQTNCGRKAENALSSVKGVTRARVIFPASAAIVFGSANVDDLIAAVQNVGFKVEEVVDVFVKNSIMEQLDPVSISSSPSILEGLSAESSDFEVAVPCVDDKNSDQTMPNLRWAKISVHGMSCASCVSMIENRIGSIAGIVSISVALLGEEANIRYDSNFLDSDDLVNSVIALGFESALIEDIPVSLLGERGKGKLKIALLSSSSKDDLIDLVQSVEGVLNISVKDNVATMVHDPDIIGARDLFNLIRKEGYGCVVVSDRFRATDEVKSFAKDNWKLFLASILFTGPIVFITKFGSKIPVLDRFLRYSLPVGIDYFAFILFALSTPVQFFFAAPFYRNAFKALKRGETNMDVLVIIGTSSAFIYAGVSLLVCIFGAGISTRSAHRDAHFFETSAMLVSFMLLGRSLETSARKRTTEAVAALMDMQPVSAILVNDTETEHLSSGDLEPANVRLDSSKEQIDGKTEQIIDITLVQVGDNLKVLPGNRIPVDGIVTHGSSEVNESMITGESTPVAKVIGSPVIGGSMNGHSALYISASRTDADSALSQIVRLIGHAQMSKAPIQRYADKVSRLFVPGVVLVSLCTWLIWFSIVFIFYGEIDYLKSMDPGDRTVFAFQFGLAVLVVSCPCALGLATPTAVMVGTGVAAKHGILIKGAETIENGSNVKAVVFDKTGTLTKGHHTVNQVFTVSSFSKEQVLEMVGTAESCSEHSLAQAMVSYVKEVKGITLGENIEFLALPGLGIKSRCRTSCGEFEVFVGNCKLIEGENIPIPDCVKSFMEAHQGSGTTVLIACDSGNDRLVIGCISLCDTIRADACDVVSSLQNLGVDVYMLSGDNAATCAETAKLCGIHPDKVFAECLPKEKCRRVAKLQACGALVAMVGDGMNDSPALTLANVGIAMGGGTDIAMKSADVILVHSKLADVLTFIDLTRAVVSRIRLNIFISFLYNVISIPFAAGLFYPVLSIRIPPTLSGLMMSLSSVAVVSSSLMLRYYRPKYFRGRIQDRISELSQPMNKDAYAELPTQEEGFDMNSV